MNKKYYPVLVVVVVVLAGLGLWKAGILMPQKSAAAMLGEGTSSLMNATSHATTVDIAVTNHVDAADTVGSPLLALHFAGAGSRGATIDDGNADYTLTGSASPVPNVSFDFGAQIRVVGKMVYLKMTKIPRLPNMGGTDLSTLSNLWFSMDPVAIAQKYGDPAMAASVQSLIANSTGAKHEEQVKAIADIYGKHPFITNAQYTGGAKSGTDDVKNISFSIDKSMFADFILNAQAYFDTLAGGDGAASAAPLPTKDEIMKLLNNMTFTDLSASVGTADHTLHSFSIKMHVANSDDSTDQSSGDIALTGTFGDLNKPVTVAAPDSFLPLDKILEMGMQAGAMH